MDDVTAARGLGYASMAIAGTEVFGQGAVEQDMLGIDEHPQLMMALGAREAVAGVTLLSQRELTPTLAAGLWSRVAGDAMDIALLGAAARKTRNPFGLAFATFAVLGITALDIIYAVRVQRKLSSRRQYGPTPGQQRLTGMHDANVRRGSARHDQHSQPNRAGPVTV